MKNDKTNSSKVILTLVIALLVAFHYSQNKHFFTVAIVLGLIGILWTWLAELAAFGWMWLAEWMGKIMSKVILSAIFFLFYTPFSFLYRLFKKNPLKLKKESSGSIYTERNHTYTAEDIENPW
jgi:hypothetical protein